MVLAVISLPSARTTFPVSLSISVPLTVYSLPGSRFVYETVSMMVAVLFASVWLIFVV